MTKRVFVVEETNDRKRWDPISAHRFSKDAHKDLRAKRVEAAEFFRDCGLAYRVRRYVPEDGA